MRLWPLDLPVAAKNVRYWHLADIASCTAHVRFRGQSGHAFLHCICLLDPKRTLPSLTNPFLPTGAGWYDN